MTGYLCTFLALPLLAAILIPILFFGFGFDQRGGGSSGRRYLSLNRLAGVEIMGAMRFISMVLGLIIGLAGSGSALAAQEKFSRANRVLVIIVDGLRPDYVTPEIMPHLHAMGERGVVGERSFAVFPSFTRPNRVSILTGGPDPDEVTFERKTHRTVVTYPDGFTYEAAMETYTVDGTIYLRGTQTRRSWKQ